jgi:hypothetical protein
LAAGAGQRRDEVARGSQALVAAAGTHTTAATPAVGTHMAAAAGDAGAGRQGASPTGGAAEGRGGCGGEGTGSGAPGTIEHSGGSREAAAPRRSRGSDAGRDTRPLRKRTRRGVWGRSASIGAVDFFSFPLYCPALAPDRCAYWAASA